MSFEWTSEFDKFFNEIKTPLANDVEPVLHNTSHSSYFTVDASITGLGANVFQSKSCNKMDVISYNANILQLNNKNFSLTTENSLL